MFYIGDNITWSYVLDDRANRFFIKRLGKEVYYLFYSKIIRANVKLFDPMN